MVRNLSANAGHVRDAGSVRGQGDHLQEAMTAHSSILAWTGKSHRQRRLVGYSAWGWEESDMTEATEYTHMHVLIHHHFLILSHNRIPAVTVGMWGFI